MLVNRNMYKFQEDDKFSFTLADEPAPPGEETSSTSDLLIGEKLEHFRVAPLIGLEFIIEIQDVPSYKCALCNKSINDEDGVIPDIISVEHRMAYLVSISLDLI